MKKNVILFYIILVFTILITVQNVFVFIKINAIAKERITGKIAYGEVALCYNQPPVLNNTCNMSVLQNETYYCQVNASDPDGNDMSFISFFITNITLFNISSSGVINYSPNYSHIGNHTFGVTVIDLPECGPLSDYEQYTLEVISTNDPPILLMPIPNQTWDYGTSITPFDLDTYFWDPDGDPITYTWTLPTSISVSIDANNEITFIPDSGWSGVTYITFLAHDPFGLNTSSNLVRLTVRAPPSQPQQPSGGGGGGGGGSSLPKCIPQWYCSEWSRCHPEGFRYRECVDLNNCSSLLNKPETNESCEFISTCYDGFKGPDEEGIDCGGPCPPCGTCYDGICNNNEDCTKGLTDMPDCGGPCQACEEELAKKINVTGKAIERPAVIEKAYPFLTRILLFILIMLLLVFTVYQISPEIKRIYGVLKKRKKKVVLEEKYEASILERLARLEHKIPHYSVSNLLSEFSTISREYFKDLFSLEVEFTYEELINEIKQRKVDKELKKVLIGFFKRSTEMEYSGISISKLEFQAMINEFREIIYLTSTHEKEEKRESELVIKPRTQLDNLFFKISQAERKLRNKQLTESKKIYLELIEDFKKLSPAQKRRVSDFVNRLYEELSLALKQEKIK
ncbi:hypothetical protein JW930_02470 [Candidatus Woesearchaeota archaeon]|nr:hypothetical protein [Candidatus Woesearchaeota archaeon]